MADLNHILKTHGLRSTAIRRNVIQHFLDKGKALSHQDVEGAMPQADRVTLYRTLASFEEHGIIHQVLDDDTVRKYALCHANCTDEHHVDNHVHFKCTECGKTKCLDNVAIPTLNLGRGYTTQKADLLVQGVCPDC